MIEGYPFTISVPSQGVSIGIEDTNAFATFIKVEASFFSRLASALDQNLVIGQTNYGSITIGGTAARFFVQLEQERAKQEFAALNRYLEAANNLRILVGQGRLGDIVSTLLSTNQAETARWIALMLSFEWVGPNQQINNALTPFRGVFLANPSIYAFRDVTSSAEALSRARSLSNKADQDRELLDQFIGEKTEIFTKLEDLYRNKLTLEEPALAWQKIANRKTRAWMAWLAIFAGLVAFPLVSAIDNWPVLSEAISKLTATTGNGSFSFAGLAVVTVPALLYGWLLKNVSRIFIQNLNLADDAAHRRSLALTYLGLLQNEKHAATDQDRAIILNALFRPIPPQSADEGPPAGVIDLIKSKA